MIHPAATAACIKRGPDMKTVLIKNGHVVDPKQNIDEIINVYAEDGRIVCLTHDEPEADLVIDAAGKIVAPGFVDIHMHEDDFDEEAGVFEKSMSISALRMGVTTNVGGQCGINHYDPAKMLDITDRDGAPVNLGLLVGHTYLRNMDGEKNKYEPVTAEDIARMEKACAEFLDKGCLGASFGVKYIPGCTWEEIIAVARPCGEKGKMIASHVRNDVHGVFDAAEELAAMGRETGAKVQFSHVGSMGGYGQMAQLLKNIEGYRAEGIDMLCDCYPYNAFSTTIGATTYDDGFLESYQADYDSVLMVSGKYAGQRCTKEIFDEMRRDDPDAATVGYFMKSEDVEMALMSPMVMLGSDGIRTHGKGHPRASGSFPKFYCDYVKTGKMSRSEAIAKMTCMPADRLNLPQKGNLMPGSDADITIFDHDAIQDHATFEDGQIPSTGFAWILIGGEVALKDDVIVNDHLGKAIRG